MRFWSREEQRQSTLRSLYQLDRFSPPVRPFFAASTCAWSRLRAAFRDEDVLGAMAVNWLHVRKMARELLSQCQKTALSHTKKTCGSRCAQFTAANESTCLVNRSQPLLLWRHNIRWKLLFASRRRHALNILQSFPKEYVTAQEETETQEILENQVFKI